MVDDVRVEDKVVTFERGGKTHTIRYRMVNGVTCIDVDRLRDRVKEAEDRKVAKVVHLRAVAKYRILERDGFKCVQCSSEKFLTIDHVNGKSERKKKYTRPVDYRLHECQTLCVFCHKRKNEENGKVVSNGTC